MEKLASADAPSPDTVALWTLCPGSVAILVPRAGAWRLPFSLAAGNSWDHNPCLRSHLIATVSEDEVQGCRRRCLCHHKTAGRVALWTASRSRGDGSGWQCSGPDECDVRGQTRPGTVDNEKAIFTTKEGRHAGPTTADARAGSGRGPCRLQLQPSVRGEKPGAS